MLNKAAARTRNQERGMLISASYFFTAM